MGVGILGGTFDPIHRAHLALGHRALEVFHLDRILVIPTGTSYFKTRTGAVVTHSFYREEMVRAAIAGEPRFALSDIEIRRSGFTYTADTLRELAMRQPETEWFFIIGADSLHEMDTWYAPEVIFRHASVIAANRNRQVPDECLLEDQKKLAERYGARIYLLPFDSPDISSSQIRAEIAAGTLPHPALPDGVNAYIARHNLYGKTLSEEEILRILEKKLKPSRFRHTLGVADTARRMAEHYGTISPKRAYLAGILHDCGKNEGTALTHGPIGAKIAETEYGIHDPGILSAIAVHTTGKPGMTDLEKFLFIADYIEPNRDRAPHLPELRRLAFEDPNRTVRLILEDTIAYLKASNTPVDERSLFTWRYYASL